MPTPTPPVVGEVRRGYRFKGGNPADQNNWEPVSGAPDDIGQRQEYQNSLQQLRDRRASVDSTGSTMEALNRFERLNQDAGTGGLLEQIPLVRSAANNLFAPRKAEMSSIAGSLQTRDVPPGQGAVSNYERELFAQGVPDITKPGPVNQNIINGIRARRAQEVDRLSFMEAYLAQNRTLNGAAEQWQGYVQANPYSQTDQQGRLVLNPRRRNWREALMGGPASPAATPTAPRPAAPAASGAPTPPASLLTEGVNRRIRAPNGQEQVWTLRAGKPVRLR